MAENRKQVWLATEGAYSDFEILAVFEREDDAEESGLGDNVESVPYFAAGERPEELVIYKAIGIEGDMEVTVTEKRFLEGEWNVYTEGARPPTRPKTRRFKPPMAKDRWMVQAICADRDAAVKSVKDRLAAAKAEV